MKGTLSVDLPQSLAWLKGALGNTPDLTVRSVEIPIDPLGRRAAIVFFTGLVDNRMVQEAIIGPLQSRPAPQTGGIEGIAETVLQAPGYVTTGNPEQVLDKVLRGSTALLVDGHAEVLLLTTEGGQQRSPEEPLSEPAVRGPRVGFVESLEVNRSLIRRRLADPALRFEALVVGTDTSTRVEMAYLEGRASRALISEVRNRLQAIRTNGVLDAGTVAEFIEDSVWSPFPQLHTTERPDRTAASLMSGKVVILVDQSPSAIMAPAVFLDFLEVPEDYYERWWAASLIRLVRAVSVFISFTLPGLWVSLSVYHQELLPTPLALSIAAGRERIPLPAALEALILEFTFEVLREAGARLPRGWGQATSIVGGLVIGQAAVQAGLVSPGMVIIVAMTGLASFATPGISAAYAFRIIRFGMLVLSGTFGVLGFGLGVMLTVLHLLNLKSFGVEYLSPVLPLMPKGLKDVAIRAPWPVMKSIHPRWWKR